MLLIWSNADCGHTADVRGKLFARRAQMKQRPGLAACTYFIGQPPPYTFRTIPLVWPLEAGAICEHTGHEACA